MFYPVIPTLVILVVHERENNFFLAPVLKTFEGHITLKPILLHKYFNLPLIEADNHNIFAVVVDLLDVL
jgi:hypothetical protein